MFCHRQYRLDTSFTWQLLGIRDVSESAEALIRTGLIIAPGTQKRWGLPGEKQAGQVGGCSIGGLLREGMHSRKMLLGTCLQQVS